MEVWPEIDVPINKKFKEFQLFSSAVSFYIYILSLMSDNSNRTKIIIKAPIAEYYRVKQFSHLEPDKHSATYAHEGSYTSRER